MPMARTRWIQHAVKPGTRESFRNYAERHHLLTEKGTIDLRRARAYVRRHEKGRERTRRLRQINLARTLRKIRLRR